MSNLLDIGSTWLASQRRAKMTKSVTYRRGAASVSILATVGKYAFRIDDGFGVEQHIETRDYILDVVDIFPTFGEPQDGDQIVDVLNGVGEIFEVQHPGGEPAWRYHDPQSCNEYRIHTHHVAPAASGSGIGSGSGS